MQKRKVTSGPSSLSIQQIRDMQRFEEMFRNECVDEKIRIEEIKDMYSCEKEQKPKIVTNDEFFDVHGVSKRDYNEGYRKVTYNF